MADPIRIDGLRVSYGTAPAVDGVSIVLPGAKVTMLVGPNGCGKSTLLKAIRRLVHAEDGSVRLAEDDILRLSEKDLARRMALLGQTPTAPEDLTVFGLVRLGRYPHQSFFQQWSRQDAAAVEQAIATTGLVSLRNRRLDTLSGGQRQRVWLAMVLAQNSEIVCLDEPINHLDIAHQLECLELVRRLNRNEMKTVVVVLHDLNLAIRYADHLVVLKEGRIVASGPPDSLVTEGLVAEVFGVESRIIPDPVHGLPLCIPVRAKPNPVAAA